ncbi:MAG: hypothetical protein MUO26_11110 [Methanotrichaceae archaeon]|nr:hypothetical protein [Methanotrichaceae archaeon]
MEPITMGLASTAISILMPYAKLGADEFIKTAGKDAYEKAKGFANWLKESLSGDKEASLALENFEKNPDRYHPVLKDILDEQLKTNNDLREELREIITDMGPELIIIQRMKEAKKVTGLDADFIASGKAVVVQESETAENMTGVRAKRIG